MSEPTLSAPSGGRTAAENSPGIGGRFLAGLCWLALLAASIGVSVTTFVRLEHRADTERQYAVASEQRRIVSTAAKLARDLERGATPAPSGVASLRTAALALHAQLSPGPTSDLEAEWRALAAGFDMVHAEWGRVLEFRTALDVARSDGRALRDSVAGISTAPPDGAAGSGAGASEEVLAIVSEQFVDALDRATLADPASLDRAGALLEAGRRTLDASTAILVQSPVAPAPRDGRAPALRADLAATAERLDAARKQLDAVRVMSEALAPVSAQLRHLDAGGARVLSLLPRFEARIGRVPELFGASLDDWLYRFASAALVALLGLVWWHRRLLRLEASTLDRAWAEAAESDWRTRGLVQDLIRAIDSLNRRRSRGSAMDDEDLEGRVREAAASLPRIVARRSQLAAALLSAREVLRSRIAAARDSLTAGSGPAPVRLNPAPLGEIEATFREATLFAMAALAREIRSAADQGSGPAEAAPEHGRPADDSESVRDVIARGFDLLERCLEGVLAGEREEHASLVFLMDDLRAVQGRESFSASLDFEPDLERVPGFGPAERTVLHADAARMLPSFRKGLEEWTTAGGDGTSPAMLMRGSVSVLARATDDGRSPIPGFWSIAAAFCAALCDGGIRAGPAVRRTVREVAHEFAATADSDEARPVPRGLLGELLLYIALADSDDAELEAVRSAFHLDRYPLSIPERTGEAESSKGEREAGVPEEIIQQLEGIRAALDRINQSSEDPASRPPQS